MELLNQSKLLFTNDFLFSLEAIMGIVGGIIAFIRAMKLPKRIYYKISRKGNEYLLGFWNASHEVIDKQDVFHFYVLGNNRLECNRIYQTDADIPIVSEKCDVENVSNLHLDEGYQTSISIGRMGLHEFKFEFLPPRSGAIFRIKNQSSDGENKGFYVNGRIKGGKADSVSSVVKSERTSEPWDVEVSFRRASVALMFCVFFSWLIDFITELSRNPKNIPGWLAIIGYTILGFFEVRRRIIYSMPNRMRRYFRKECKQNGYKASYVRYDYDKKLYDHQ